MSGSPGTPRLLDYALLVTRVGLTSFGGGISAWMLRLIVDERRWMTEAEFLSGLAVCQVFPGINVLNLAIWLGFRLHGATGALVGALAMIVPPGLVLILLATLFGQIASRPWAHVALNGVAAAAVGMIGSLTWRAGRRAATGPVPVLIGAATLLSVGVLHWPLVPVVAALAVLGIAHAWRAV